MGEGMCEGMIDREMANDVIDVLAKMYSEQPGRNIKIFIRHEVYGETLKEIGAEFGISQERVRQLCEKQKRYALTFLIEKYGIVYKEGKLTTS